MVEYVPGKLNFIADALSRAPVFQPEEKDHQDVLVQTLKIESNDPQLHSAALAQSISRLSRMIRLPAVLSAFEYREKS